MVKLTYRGMHTAIFSKFAAHIEKVEGPKLAMTERVPNSQQVKWSLNTRVDKA